MKYTSRDTSNATEMNKHEQNIELMYGLTIWLGWLAMASLSWLVGTGLGYMLFY